MASRWANWSNGLQRQRYFQDFLKEAGQPLQGDPQQIAQQNGWQPKGFGWYQDASGQTVAREVDGVMYAYSQEPTEVDKQPDMGNPTPAGSAMKPADRARSMGLQSNGRGGYVDPKTGQTVARTVNNELVFYDQRPGGGAVSDGAGGQSMAQATPSWQDPVTGLVVTPPAKPESPQEMAAIPDPIPAQSPSGYNQFIQQKKLLAYAQNKRDLQAQELQPPQGDMDLGGDAEDAMLPDQEVPAMPMESKMTFKAMMEAARQDPTNPQKPGMPSLDDLLAGGGQSNNRPPQPSNNAGAAYNSSAQQNPTMDGTNQNQPETQIQSRGTPQVPPPERFVQDVNGDGTIDREDVALQLQNLRGQLGGAKRQTKPIKAILERLDHPVAGPRMKKFLAAMLDQDKRLRTTHQELSTFNDEEGALRFLTEGMGLVNDNGTIRAGAPNRELRALGGAGMPGEGRGESRAIGFRELQSLLDPTRQAMLQDAQDDETGEGAKQIHRMALQNDIPWELAEKLYDMMERGLQTKLDGWGKPEAAQGTFTPMGPVEFMKDAEGNFTGETNIDVLARTDPEEYKKHFSTGNAGNRGRGIFNLQKHLAQRGMGEFSGLPSFFDFDTSTPDHIMGRSSGALPNNRAKDDPLNLGFERRGLNQFKVSSQMGEERDTLKSLINAAQGVKGALGSVEYDEEDYDDITESPNFLRYLAYRFAQSDFDPAKIAARAGESGIDQYPDNLEDFMGLDDNAIKSLVGKNESKNPLGLNMRNMSMLAPRANQRPLVTNTWGGAPGGGLEFNPLQGYRRAMLASALFDPNMKQQLADYEEELRQPPKGRKKPLTDEQVEKALAKRRRDLVAHNHFGPQKAIASLYGMGQMNNEEYIDALRELATRRLGFMAGGDQQEIYDQLMDGLGSTLDEYRQKLDEKMPEGPYRFTEEELGPNLDQPYMRAVMSSNFGRSRMPPALVEMFDAIKGNENIKDNMIETALKLDLNTVL